MGQTPRPVYPRRFIVIKAANMPPKTERIKLFCTYATRLAVKIPIIVGSFIASGDVKTPLMISILRDVYGINVKNLLKSSFTVPFFSNTRGKSLGR